MKKNPIDNSIKTIARTTGMKESILIIAGMAKKPKDASIKIHPTTKLYFLFSMTILCTRGILKIAKRVQCSRRDLNPGSRISSFILESMLPNVNRKPDVQGAYRPSLTGLDDRSINLFLWYELLNPTSLKYFSIICFEPM